MATIGELLDGHVTLAPFRVLLFEHQASVVFVWAGGLRAPTGRSRQAGDDSQA
jgi:hypothetical protein